MTPEDRRDNQRITELERELAYWRTEHDREVKRRSGEVMRFSEALEEIANADYRGNRSQESIIANKALEAK